MKKEKQTNENVELEACYYRAMHDLDIFTYRLKYVDKELKMAKEEIKVLTLAQKAFLGMDKYVENNLMKQFYDVKDSMYMMRKSIRAHHKNLSDYFILQPAKEVLYNYKAKDVIALMDEKEGMIDGELDKCGAYLKLFEVAATV